MGSFRAIELTQDQIDEFYREGYLIVHDVLSEKEVKDFLEHQSRPRPPEIDQGLRPHTVDPQWQYLAKHPNVAGVATQLLGGRMRIVVGRDHKL